MTFKKNNLMYIIIGSLIVIVSISFARHAYGIILPFMKNGLSISYNSASWLGTMTSLGYLISIVFSGHLSIKWGEKKAIILGLLLILIGFLNLSKINGYLLNLSYMFLLGIGTAFVFTPLISIITKWFPNNKGLVIGIMNGSSGIGLFFVGILVPFLTNMYPENGCRIIWMVLFLIILSVFIVTLIFLNPPPNKSKKEVNVDISKKNLYLNKKIINIGLIYGVIGYCLIVQSLFNMSFMLEEGLAKNYAGKLISLNGILSIFSAPLWGSISDRLGRKYTLLIAVNLVCLSVIIPILLSNAKGFLLSLFLQGIVSIGIMTLIQAFSVEIVSSSYAPIVFSYITFYFAIGQLIGPALSGTIIQHFGFKSAFTLLSVLLVFCVYLTVRIPLK